MSANTGPLGQPRGIGFVIVISIITFGIYHLYWTYKTFEEMKQRTGEGLGGVLGLVIGILISIVNAFVIHSPRWATWSPATAAAPVQRLDGPVDSADPDRGLVHLDRERSRAH